MLTYTLIAFALAALGGATLAYLRIVKKTVCMPLALVHGLVAATGLGMLAYEFLQTDATGLMTVALALFVLAALGGFTLFSFHLRARPLPIPLVLAHGAGAVTAFVILLVVRFW